MSAAITAAEVTMLRTATQRQMTMTCTVQRRNQTANDPYGEVTYGAWFNNATAVPCLLYQESGPGEQQTPERASIVRGWLLLLPAGTDVTTGDQITNVANVVGETQQAGPLDILQVIREPSHLTAVLGALA